jgi:tagatose-6-phosphate ketose/aldose isomerase
MNRFLSLQHLPLEEKEKHGVVHTPSEIAQQPDIWPVWSSLLQSYDSQWAAFLAPEGEARDKPIVVLTGAGTSEHIGNAIAAGIGSMLDRITLSISSPDLLTHFDSLLLPTRTYVLVSFSRSGRSPETVEVARRARQASQVVRQIIFTCDEAGDLASEAWTDPESLVVVPPREANDRSLAMTSSFSCMALGAMCMSYHGKYDLFDRQLNTATQGASRVIQEYGDLLYDFARKRFGRICFLGSGPLQGAMQECALKILEMTDGKIASTFNSFLGLRHGPKVFLRDDCRVVGAISGDACVRRYELDLLRELKKQITGFNPLLICNQRDAGVDDLACDVIELFPGGDDLSDTFRVVTDVLVGQVIGLFASLELGLMPDSPNQSGSINRVVEGVCIYS